MNPTQQPDNIHPTQPSKKNPHRRKNEPISSHLFIHLISPVGPPTAHSVYLPAEQMPKQNSLKSPLVASSTSSSTILPYFSSYSLLTRWKCIRSQCSLTNRLMSNSNRCWRSCLEADEEAEASLEEEERGWSEEGWLGSMRSMRAWWRSMASREGRLMTPFRMCAMTSPCSDQH